MKLLFIYREPINLAVLQLKEDGYLEKLKKKWWFEQSECTDPNEKAGSQKVPFILIKLTCQSNIYLVNYSNDLIINYDKNVWFIFTTTF